MASRIVAVDGVDGQAVARCADEYATELEALDTDIADLTARLPVERRILVTTTMPTATSPSGTGSRSSER